MKTFEIEVQSGKSWNVQYVEATTETGAHKAAIKQSGFKGLYIRALTLSFYN